MHEFDGILMATYMEAKPFIESKLFAPIEDKPFPVYKNETHYLIISGIGKINAGIASTYLMSRFKIDSMYNIGAAGAATDDFKTGDILHINTVIDYSHFEKESKSLKPDTLPNYKSEILATCDMPVISAEERTIVGQKAPLIDMEGFAFVYACKIFKTKSYLFKIITDTPADTTGDEIILNIRNTRDLLYQFFMDNFLNPTSFG
jgi:adenosylhomocysteine nucleosidase